MKLERQDMFKGRTESLEHVQRSEDTGLILDKDKAGEGDGRDPQEPADTQEDSALYFRTSEDFLTLSF